jgi:UDP-3-O-[3-hydroxymyristoyl] glucosamine N-acyltransferase
MKKTAADIKRLIGPEKCRIIGDMKREFCGVAPIVVAKIGDLAFCTKKPEDAVPTLKKSRASVILCSNDVLSQNIVFSNKTLVAVDNPRLWFMRCLNAFFPAESRRGIHPSAFIGKNCKIDEDVYIGPNVSIGNRVLIGKGTKIYSGVQIHDRARIGKNVVLKSGCVIGSDGFGFERNDEGTFEKFPHVGGVVIKDDVEIGGNTCVDRGTLSNTIIGKGTKIDNLVHIAHNVVVGKNCAIIALAMIGGGAKIGDGAWVAPTACVRDGITVGKQSLVGMGAVVTKNVPDGDVVVGVPAKSVKEAKK